MIVIPLCLWCKHFDAERMARKEGVFCTAFPDGVPVPLLCAEHDHRTPYPGDRGIQFEPNEDLRPFFDPDYQATIG